MERMRIIGQCGVSDFKNIEHLVAVLESPDMLDMSTLTSRQVFAFNFYTRLYRKGISYDLAKSTVRQVLFWGETDFIKAIEIKFKPNSEKAAIMKFKRLWDKVEKP